MNGRISRDEVLMRVAETVALRGTCSRLQVGAVFSRDNRIIVTGYNGAPAGVAHCDHSNDPDAKPIGWVLGEGVNTELWDSKPGKIMVVPDDTGVFHIQDPGCQVAAHAEQNAIAFAARYGVALDGSELHVTHAPCLPCARSVINAGVRKVTYSVPYRKTEGIDLLNLAGVEVYRMAEVSNV